MDQREQQEALQKGLAEFAVSHPEPALAWITGAFVALIEHRVRETGADPNKEIAVDGNPQRSIMIGAVKPVKRPMGFR